MGNLLQWEIRKLWKARHLTILLIVMMIGCFAMGVVSAGKPEQTTDSATYEEKMESLAYQARSNYQMIRDKHSKEALYQRAVYARYTALSKTDVSGEVRGFETVLSTFLPYTLAFAFGVWVAILLAFEEQQGTLILQSFQKRRYAVGVCKMEVLGIVSVLATVCLTGCFSIGVWCKNGFAGITNPVQAIAQYARCPYALSVGGALCLRMLSVIIAILCFGFLAYLLTWLMRRIVLSLFCNMLILVTQILAFQLSTDIYSFFYAVNLPVILTGTWLMRLCGGKYIIFVPQLALFLTTFGIGAGVFAAGGIFCYRYLKTVHTVKNRRQRETHVQRHGHTLHFYEYRKLLPTRVFCMVAILLVAQVVVLALMHPKTSDVFQKVYRNYVTQMQELPFAEQCEFVDAEKTRANAIIRHAEECRILYRAGEIEREEYQEANAQEGAAKMILSVMAMIDEQLVVIGAYRAQGVEASLVYATGWQAMCAGEADYFCFFAVLFCLSSYAVMDKETRFAQIANSCFVCTAREKRARLWKRCWYMATVTMGIVTLFLLTKTAFFAMWEGLPAWDHAAVGAGLAFGIPEIKLWQVVGMHLGIAWLGGIGLTLLCEIYAQMISHAYLLLLLGMSVEGALVLLSFATDGRLSFFISGYFDYAGLHRAWYAIILFPLCVCAITAWLHRKQTSA